MEPQVIQIDNTPPESRLELEGRVAELERRLQKYADRIVSAEKKLAEANKRLENITPHRVEKFLNEMREDASHLHDRLQLMVLKTCVMSETYRFAAGIGSPRANELIGAMMSAVDLPDGWWKAREAYDLGRWFIAFLEEQ